MGGIRQQRTKEERELIAARAMRLFATRGFDAVTVAEVARSAQVTEKTVFNHFATKEDLVYSTDESFQDQLLTAVRDRGDEQSPFAAAAQCLLSTYERFAGDEQRERRHLELARVVAGTPALQARERSILAGYASGLAKAIEVPSAPREMIFDHRSSPKP